MFRIIEFGGFSVSEKLRIQKAKLQISLSSELADYSNPSSHQCDKCEYFSAMQSQIFRSVTIIGIFAQC